MEETTERVTLFPLHEKQRAEAPKAFLLTLAEAKRIMRAARVMFPVLCKYIHVDEDKIYTPEVQEQLRSEILEAFNSKRINRTSLLKVCNKVRNSNYWSYSLTGITLNTKTGDRETYFSYTVESNIDSLDNLSITPHTYPAFYHDLTIAEQAVILNIPGDVLYIPHEELSKAKTLYNVIAESKEPIKESADFITVKSSKIIDVLNSVTKMNIDEVKNKRSYNEEGLLTDIFEITAGNGVTISVDAGKFDELALFSPATDKLKTLLENYTLINGYHDNRFYLTLDQYMQALGLKDRKEAAKKFRAGAEIIHAIKVTAETPDNSFKSRSVAQEMDYISGRGQQGSYITGKWSDAYLEHLEHTKQQIQMPRSIFTIPDNRRNEYRFAKSFNQQKRRNIGKPNNIENRLRVSTLLEISTLPKYETLPNKAQASQKIIDPFIKAFDYLEEHNILTWEFRYSRTDKKDGRLSDEDLNRLFTDYSLFSSLVVEVKWPTEPDYSNLLEHKQRQLEKARASGSSRRRGRPRKQPVKEG